MSNPLDKNHAELKPGDPVTVTGEIVSVTTGDGTVTVKLKGGTELILDACDCERCNDIEA